MGLAIPYWQGLLRLIITSTKSTIFSETDTNLVSFVSFVALLVILPLVLHLHLLLLVLQPSVTDNIDINTSGVVTTSYADVGKITIQQPGAIADAPIEVGTATTMFRIKADGMVMVKHHYLHLN